VKASIRNAMSKAGQGGRANDKRGDSPDGGGGAVMRRISAYCATRFPPLDVGHSKSGPARSEKEGFCNTQGGGLAVHLVGEAGDADADIPKRLFEPHGVRLPEGEGSELLCESLKFPHGVNCSSHHSGCCWRASAIRSSSHVESWAMPLRSRNRRRSSACGETAKD
jgi:hypothetical protein